MAFVSIIIPCFNEQNTIGLLLEAIYDQDYPRDQIEVIIADGLSSDQTRPVIAAFQENYSALAITVVDNQARIIPAGINTAIAAAQGEIIIRLDAHSTPRPDYVSRCVAALEAGLGDNVGGVWEIQPRSGGWQARSIAAAAAHPLGVGDAHYRHATTAQKVDTVPFGAFRRELIDKVGSFNEDLLANEDYEFNARIRAAGGTIWLDPAIRTVYFSRGNLLALARQYWRYGYWKVRMLRMYPQTLRWRQAVPPVFVLSLAGLGALALALPVARWLLLGELVLYVLALGVAGAHTAIIRRTPVLAVGVPLAIAVMHICWGGAFLWSVIESFLLRK